MDISETVETMGKVKAGSRETVHRRGRVQGDVPKNVQSKDGTRRAVGGTSSSAVVKGTREDATGIENAGATGGVETTGVARCIETTGTAGAL